MNWEWPQFDQKQFASRGNGDCLMDAALMDMLAVVQSECGKLTITSGYRDPVHNAKVGGAPMSLHKFGKAVDISLRGIEREQLLKSCERIGVTGFGFGQTFLHIDIGKARRWNYGPKSKEAWHGLAG